MCQRCTDYHNTHRRPPREERSEYLGEGRLLFRAKRVELAATHPTQEETKR